MSVDGRDRLDHPLRPARLRAYAPGEYVGQGRLELVDLVDHLDDLAVGLGRPQQLIELGDLLTRKP